MNLRNNMTLIDIKNHMITVKFATINSLCRLFQTDPETLRCLLSHWIKKGKIRRCDLALCAKKCSGCPAASGESYEWVAPQRVRGDKATSAG